MVQHHMAWPAGLQIFERGWLSSNNILIEGQSGTALIDSGYGLHAPQTLALVQSALQDRPLDLLINTHLHSDHCGGNAALQAAYRSARALILPSEIEGFGLPALEAYYLGTPVCFVRGTSVEEVLGVATCKGGFSLDQPESLFSALAEVMRMSPGEVRECGLKLREVYAAEKVVERMMAVFQQVRNCKC